MKEEIKKLIDAYFTCKSDEEKLVFFHSLPSEGKDLTIAVYWAIQEDFTKVVERKTATVNHTHPRPVWLGDLNSEEAQNRWNEIKQKHDLK
jgi:hypothetical protein